MTVVQDVIQAINAGIVGAVPFVVSAFGNSRVIERDNRRFPSVLYSKDGVVMLPNEKKPCLVYHRLISTRQADAGEDGFGCEDEDDEITIRAYLFTLGIQSVISKDLKDTNDVVGLIIADAMPKGVFEASDGLRMAHIVSHTTTFDSLEILNSEFGAGVIDPNRLPDLVATRTEYEVRGRICSDICT